MGIMTNINDYCEKNQDFQQLLDVFKDAYIPAYNKRRVALRNEIKTYRNLNFNTWYYSIANAVCCVSPAAFLNSAVYNEFDSETVVFPVCNPVYKRDKLMDLTYAFRVFTLEDHPFIRDMRLFLEVVPDVSSQKEEKQDENIDSIWNYAYENASFFESQADFTFHERPYLATLGEICERLSLLAVTFDKGVPKILLDEKNIRAFFSLPGKEKLDRVVAKMVERFLDSFERFGISDCRPTPLDVLDALQESRDLDTFMDIFFPDLLDDLTMLLMDAETLDALTEDIAESEKVMKAQSITLICCSYFFTAFGQYLQLIQPEYYSPFQITELDDIFLELIKTEDEDSELPDFKGRVGSMVYLLPPGGYDLTPLGVALFDLDASLLEEQHSIIPTEEYQEVLEGMLDEFDDEYVEALDWLADRFGDLETEEELLSALSNFLQIDMPKEGNDD